MKYAPLNYQTLICFLSWKVYLILDEFILAGELQETSKKVIPTFLESLSLCTNLST